MGLGLGGGLARRPSCWVLPLSAGPRACLYACPVRELSGRVPPHVAHVTRVYESVNGREDAPVLCEPPQVAGISAHRSRWSFAPSASNADRTNTNRCEPRLSAEPSAWPMRGWRSPMKEPLGRASPTSATRKPRRSCADVARKARRALQCSAGPRCPPRARMLRPSPVGETTAVKN